MRSLIPTHNFLTNSPCQKHAIFVCLFYPVIDMREFVDRIEISATEKWNKIQERKISITLSAHLILKWQRSSAKLSKSKNSKEKRRSFTPRRPHLKTFLTSAAYSPIAFLLCFVYLLINSSLSLSNIYSFPQSTPRRTLSPCRAAPCVGNVAISCVPPHMT